MNEQEKFDHLVAAAQSMARAAHDSIGQKRKYTGDPYWVHTDAVAEIVASVPGRTLEMVQAAHLHDVIEDVTHHEKGKAYDLFLIGNTFGKKVADLVVELTDVYTSEAWPGRNRAQRKALERERLGKISNAGKTVKLADLLNNSADIVANDPGFARTYLEEKLALLPLLRGGDETLWARALKQALDGEEILSSGS